MKVVGHLITDDWHPIKWQAEEIRENSRFLLISEAETGNKCNQSDSKSSQSGC